MERFFLKGEQLIPEKLKETKASQIMTKKPISLHHGTTVKTALETFEGSKLRVLPVIDDHNHVIGVVNLEDLGYIDVRRQNMTLSETVMHSPVFVNGEASLEKVAQTMMETQQDHIFVIDHEEQLIAVISGIDVVKKILELISA